MTLPNNTEKPGSLRTWLDFIEGINPDDIDLGLNRVGGFFCLKSRILFQKYSSY